MLWRRTQISIFLFPIIHTLRISPSCNNRSFAVVHTDVAALNGGLGSTESKTNILVPSSATLSDSLALGLGLGVGKDMRLLLESALRLDGQLGRHVCDVINPTL